MKNEKVCYKCGKPLNPNEIEYYENECESCTAFSFKKERFGEVKVEILEGTRKTVKEALYKIANEATEIIELKYSTSIRNISFSDTEATPFVVHSAVVIYRAGT